jgi:hypothetical protein
VQSPIAAAVDEVADSVEDDLEVTALVVRVPVANVLDEDVESDDEHPGRPAIARPNSVTTTVILLVV